MRPRNHCERCAKKLHSGAVHCVACGGRAVPRREGRSRIVTGAIVTALSLIIVLAVGLSDRYVPAVSDWYSRMVIHHAPEGTMPYLPGVTGDDRAFYSCARTVVRNCFSIAARSVEHNVPAQHDRGFRIHDPRVRQRQARRGGRRFINQRHHPRHKRRRRSRRKKNRENCSDGFHSQGSDGGYADGGEPCIMPTPPCRTTGNLKSPAPSGDSRATEFGPPNSVL